MQWSLHCEVFLTCTALLGVPETKLSGCTGHVLSVLLTDALGIAKKNCSAWVKHICEWQGGPVNGNAERRV